MVNRKYRIVVKNRYGEFTSGEAAEMTADEIEAVSKALQEFETLSVEAPDGSVILFREDIVRESMITIHVVE